MTTQTVLKGFLVHALAEAMDRGEMLPIGDPIAGQQLVRAPERISVSLGALDLLAVAAAQL